MKQFLKIIFKLFQVSVKKRQPYIKNVKNKKLINYWWSKVFYNQDNLQKLTKNCPIYPRRGYGLIYYYFVNNRLRYIGQTRNSLKWRLTKRQSSQYIGYNYSIKRQMLNAYRSGNLTIKTNQVKIKNLGEIEKKEIKLYSKNGCLWNIEHNDYYQRTNRLH